VRLILGLLKGALIGGAVGAGAYALDLGGGFHWVTYGLVGAFVGLLVGRPFWVHLSDKSSTVVVSVLKAIVGYGVAVGIYALVAKVWGGFELTVMDYGTRNLYDWQPLLGAGIGALYGAWVEVDDTPAAEKAARAEKKKLAQAGK
jgi:hypothetical protein